MRNRDVAKAFFFTMFIAIFLILNLAFKSLLIFRANLLMLGFVLLLEYAAFGIAYELAVFAIELLSRDIVAPTLETVSIPRIAILYCACDDADPTALSLLCDQSSADIFILDDSRDSESRQMLDKTGLRVVRRKSRKGFKAGNLNNWLAKYGDQFEYFIVLDADSIVPSDFVSRVMLYAEHPENQDVAIFGTLIEPWNDENQFASLQSVMARLGWREALRVNNRIDCTLAVGHNEIYRTAAIREVGGFNEHYVAEDTATCIEVLQKGWRCLTIPVKSYERVPSNLCEFQKRRARHACQTFQLEIGRARV